MKIEVTARRLTVDAKTKDTIAKRLEKLSKVLPREAEAKVVVRLEKRGVLVEVTITAPLPVLGLLGPSGSMVVTGRAIMERQ